MVVNDDVTTIQHLADARRARVLPQVPLKYFSPENAQQNLIGLDMNTYQAAYVHRNHTIDAQSPGHLRCL